VTASYSPEDCSARQKEAEQVWWYVCTGPKAPYCTLFIDHHAIEMRMWLWQTWKYGVDGVLIWSTNYWTSDAAYPGPEAQDPWEDPMGWVSGYSTSAGTKIAWGNGDGRLVYPPNRDPADTTTLYRSGPVNSIRWEMLRDGMEDYEYFHLLRSLVEEAEKEGRDTTEARALLDVPGGITSGMTEFTRDPRLLLDHRERMAEAIESLLEG